MAIPEPVQQCLDLQYLDYAITVDPQRNSGEGYQLEVDRHTPNPKNIVRLLVLQDSIGKLQVMLPENHLIDLTEICEQLGRNLQAIPPDEEKKFLEQLGTTTFPSIPQLTGIPTVADKKLFDNSVLYLSSGMDGCYIRLDQEQFKRAINEVDLGSFAKPIPENEQKSSEVVLLDEDQIISAVEKFTTLRIKQRLDSTLEIPPMPDTAEKIIKLRVDPDAGVGELTPIVETDPSLAAQVVSWAASPFYGAPGKIKSVHDAVVRVLGFDLVVNLALGLALGKTLNLPKDGPRSVTPYWHQALFTAFSMERLVAKMPVDKRPVLGLAYLSGLLHNFGYLILGYIFPPHFSVISRFVEVNQHIGHHHIEEYVLGVSREQISSWLLNTWSMPKQVVYGIRWQQYSEYEGEHAVYANLLYITNQLLKERGIGDQLPRPIPNSMYTRTGLTPDSAREAIDAIVEKSSDIQALAKLFDGNK